MTAGRDPFTPSLWQTTGRTPSTAASHRLLSGHLICEHTWHWSVSPGLAVSRGVAVTGHEGSRDYLAVCAAGIQVGGSTPGTKAVLQNTCCCPCWSALWSTCPPARLVALLSAATGNPAAGPTCLHLPSWRHQHPLLLLPVWRPSWDPGVVEKHAVVRIST